MLELALAPVLAAALAAGGGERPAVAATIPPVADLVRRVAGPGIEVATLLPAGASPHTFEPAPSSVRAVARSRVLFVVGAGLDAWAGRLAAAGPPGMVTVDLSEGVDLVTGLADDHRDGGGDADGGANPHYWLDPVVAADLAGRIEAALAAAFPREAGGLRSRAAALEGELRDLDAEIRASVARLPGRRLVTFHDSWPYLARRYGLEVAGVIELAPGREPGPRHLAGIVERIRSLKVGAVFAEPQLPSRPAEVIAREAGVRLVLLDPLGGVPGREGYLDLMRYNLRRLEEGLR